MKHKSTKACAITKEVRQAVALRDNGRCIICGIVVPVSCSNAHFIPRSKLGLGIEQNILTLCMKCHNAYDNSDKRSKYKEIFREYLKNIYGNNWDESKLIYKKY